MSQKLREEEKMVVDKNDTEQLETELSSDDITRLITGIDAEDSLHSYT